MDVLIRDIPNKLLKDIDDLAESQRRTRTQQIIRMLEDAIEQLK